MAQIPANPSVDVKALKPFKRFIMTIGNLPTSYLESLTYAELVMWLCNFLQEQVIPAVNNNASAVEELQGLYVELKSYVDDYFTNLDVQEEINNKLDEMVEDGTLPEIIASYLQTKAIFGFDNVQSMKEATNLINGSFAQTLGYYDKNDGGNALYKIRNATNDDVIDEKFIINLNRNNLIAELICNGILNIKQIGCYGNNTNDDTNYFTSAFNYIKNHNIYNLIIPAGTYYVTNEIRLNNINNLKIISNGTIHIKSSSSQLVCFSILNCDTIEFNGVNITSTRDQTEPAPAGHTREDNTGSNITGIWIKFSKNIKILNSNFNNMSVDIFTQGDINNTNILNENITIDNIKSNNASLPVYLSYTNNANITNSNFISAKNMGSGDHIFYLSAYCKNIRISNTNMESDKYYGAMIYPGQTNYPDIEDAYPKDVYVSNCNFIGARFISVLTNGNVSFDNCTFTSCENADNETCIYVYRNSNLSITNCTFNISRVLVIPNFYGKFIFKNNYVNSSYTNYLMAIYGTNDYTPFIDISNNSLYLKGNLIYTSTETASALIYIKDNNIIYDNESNNAGLISIRSNYCKLYAINNLIKCINTGKYTNFSYNPGVTEINTYSYNNILYNFTRYTLDDLKQYNVSINNYLDNNLITL